MKLMKGDLGVQVQMALKQTKTVADDIEKERKNQLPLEILNLMFLKDEE